ncbi:hypothetical protein AF72_02835 [Xylella taiwanensis]|uniref:Uncharacterized protein n=1 Tax=Xylella taiwanensis TaxID=1444770 RepID=Z9JLP9_9GAMM|nr:hypothetical protein AF72_02835 [Xylella taiwanensis]
MMLCEIFFTWGEGVLVKFRHDRFFSTDDVDCFLKKL